MIHTPLMLKIILSENGASPMIACLAFCAESAWLDRLPSKKAIMPDGTSPLSQLSRYDSIWFIWKSATIAVYRSCELERRKGHGSFGGRICVFGSGVQFNL
jgi:hypothetical protein